MELYNPCADPEFPGRTITYTDVAGGTATWTPGPQGVVVFCTTAAYVSVGVGVTATIASTPVPANTPIAFKIPQGTGAPWRVSAIRIADSGSVYAKPCNIS